MLTMLALDRVSGGCAVCLLWSAEYNKVALIYRAILWRLIACSLVT